MLEMIRIQLLSLDPKRKKNKFDLKFDQSCGENTKKLNIICVCLSRELCTVLATDKRHYKPIRHSYSGIHANTPDIAIPTNSRPLKSWRSLQKKNILFFYKTPIEFILTLLISNALFFLSNEWKRILQSSTAIYAIKQHDFS